MGVSEKSESSTNRWPSGIAFLMYCAGISLVLLVGYVIFSGKGFDFSANDKGVAFKSALNQGGVSGNPEVRAEKSNEIKERFEQASHAVPAEIQDEETSQSPAPPTPVRKRHAAATMPKPEETPTLKKEVTNPFNGSWTGNGSVYVFEQNGSTVALLETTNGISTSFAQGTANGAHASLMAANISGLTFPVEVYWDGSRIKLTAMGTEFFLDPS
jgi:hypothetical protein